MATQNLPEKGLQTLTRGQVHLGYEVGTGEAVAIPLRHMVVTGQTQEAGKTTTLEALIARSGVQAVAFITKRGEGSFGDARIIRPYFQEQADWQFVASILEASRGEKLKFERAWIIRASKGARTLADVQRNVRKALETAKGLSADVYLTLDAYLQAVVPQVSQVQWADRVDLAPGVSAMDLTGLNVEMQHLVIRSTIAWVLEHAEDTVVVVPEAWKFIPQGRGTPVKLAAEAYIRQAAALRNYLWLDSQDIAGVEKTILKSVPVWILGVQREANEVKRTLAQIPTGIREPRPEAIATLRLGEFYVCHGTQITKVYVQPAWMSADDARAHARGEPITITRAEGSVNEREARELRAENVRLRDEVLALEGRVDQLTAELHSLRPPPPPKNEAAPAAISTPAVSEDELYQRFLARLRQEDPAAVLRVLTTRPELQVEVQRETIEVDGTSLRGRVARLIVDGFFAEGQTGAATQTELARLGKDPGPGNTYTELKKLAELGFFTVEDGRDERSRPRTLYRAVPGMLVHVVERGS